MAGMCIVEIRPGRGGRDAEDFAGYLAESVRAWAARSGHAAAVASPDARAVTVSVPGAPSAALG